MLTLGGEKMSKSLGNTLLVSEIVTQWRPAEVRYYLGSAHYRSRMEYSTEAMDEAAAAYSRIENFVERAWSKWARIRNPPVAAGVRGRHGR